MSYHEMLYCLVSNSSSPLETIAFCCLSGGKVEPRGADDIFLVIGRWSAWQISNVSGEESGLLRVEMLLSLGYPGKENLR